MIPTAQLYKKRNISTFELEYTVSQSDISEILILQEQQF